MNQLDHFPIQKPGEITKCPRLSGRITSISQGSKVRSSSEGRILDKPLRRSSIPRFTGLSTSASASHTHSNERVRKVVDSNLVHDVKAPIKDNSLRGHIQTLPSPIKVFQQALEEIEKRLSSPSKLIAQRPKV